MYQKDKIQICNQCKNGFSYKSLRKFCSKNCASESMKLNKPCKFCGKVIENPKGLSLKNRVYCSVKCQGEARKGIKFSIEWKSKISEGRKNSEKCKGENLYNWKGGKETEKQRMKIHNQNRRHRLKIKIDPKFLICLLIAQKKTCFYCEKKFTKTEKYQLEHLTAVAKGGDNQKYNLVYACWKCNSKKRTKSMEDYMLQNLISLDKWEYIYTTALVLMEKLRFKK